MPREPKTPLGLWPDPAHLKVGDTVNARRKAEILCEASGVKLGQLLNVDYNWGEMEIYSKTQYDLSEGEDACVLGTDKPTTESSDSGVS